MSKKLALIIGSTRGIRAGLDVTAYVQKVFATSTSKVEATIEVIDLKTCKYIYCHKILMEYQLILYLKGTYQFTMRKSHL